MKTPVTRLIQTLLLLSVLFVPTSPVFADDPHPDYCPEQPLAWRVQLITTRGRHSVDSSVQQFRSKSDADAFISIVNSDSTIQLTSPKVTFRRIATPLYE